MWRGDAAASDLAQRRDVGISGRGDRGDATAGRDVRGQRQPILHPLAR